MTPEISFVQDADSIFTMRTEIGILTTTSVGFAPHLRGYANPEVDIVVIEDVLKEGLRTE